MDLYRTHSAPSQPSLFREAPPLLLRLGAGFCGLFFHAWSACLSGWEYLWKKTPWPLMDEFQDFPAPAVMPPLYTILLTLGSCFLILGLFTRLSAAVLLAGALTGVFVYLNYPDTTEKFALYAVIYAALVARGGGAISLDGAFSGRRKR